MLSKLVSFISFGYKQNFNSPYSIHINKVGSQKPLFVEMRRFFSPILKLSIDCQGNGVSVYEVKTLQRLRGKTGLHSTKYCLFRGDMQMSLTWKS